ncbi:phage tail protein [Shinella sp. CPCC 100929]|uniref:Phage tail protein n=1 Tax=Shinella lacus TaxID=2654216 RepID=A0ABT1R6Z6_9HYPH|nr:phage tail protein [Shinella lacus]MCQ4630951.1 phage tail protein [Shinella lacus]
MSLMQFGGFKFEMRGVSPRRVTSLDEWRWPSTERLSGESAIQFLGRGPGELSMEAVLFPLARSGHSESAIGRLQAVGDAGIPLPFIRGDWRMLGWYALTSIEQDHSYLDQRGRPGMIGLLASWSRFGADGPGGGLTGFFGL